MAEIVGLVKMVGFAGLVVIYIIGGTSSDTIARYLFHDLSNKIRQSLISEQYTIFCS